jgi:hypothetical protein
MNNISPWVVALVWLLIGAACGCAHLLWLRRSLNRLDANNPGSMQRLVLGLPLRLLAVAPFLFFAARSGLPSSGGFILGSLLGRWGLCLGTMMRQTPATWPHE